MKQRARELDLRENALVKHAMEIILFVGVAVKNMLTLDQEKSCVWQLLNKTMHTDKDQLPFLYRFQGWNTLNIEKFREGNHEDLTNIMISR